MSNNLKQAFSKTLIIVASFLFSCTGNETGSYVKSYPENSVEVLCLFCELSPQFDFKVIVKSEGNGSAIVKGIFLKKNTGAIIDSISYKSEGIYIPPMFMDCGNIRSYPTGKNVDNEVIDNSPGEIVVADVNFDELDDLAIVSDFGGNGGFIYNFYVQKPDHRFEIDTFLSNTIMRFPIEFNREIKTLTIEERVSTTEKKQKVVQLLNGQWIEIDTKLIN